MFYLQLVYIFFAAFIIFYLLLPFLTVVLHFFAKEKIDKDVPVQNTDFGCIITAYRNAKISIPLIESLLKQSHQNLHIYLIADDCDISDFTKTDKKLTVLNPDPPLKLKAKSIIHGI